MRYMKNDLTQDELMTRLTYDPKTGNFYRKVGKKLKVGHLIEGHIGISIKNKKYMAQRLAFLYMKGYFPENNIIHINRNTTDNRWSNLKEGSWECVMSCKKSQNKVTGVNYNKLWKCWNVHLNKNNKTFFKSFKKFDDAVRHRYKLEKRFKICKCNHSKAYYYLLENKLFEDVYYNLKET